MSRIAMFTGRYNYWGHLDPTRLYSPKGGQLGGGETATLQIAMHLALMGHEVIIGANIDSPTRVLGLTIIPQDLFVPTVWAIGADVLVSWDVAALFRFNLPAKKKVLAYQLNDSDAEPFDYVIDYYFHPSEWHAARFAAEFGVPPAKQHSRMTNGIDPEVFSTARGYAPRSKRVVWASSPDRGLHHLLRMWPAVQERHPDAELHVYYDMSRWIATMKQLREAYGDGQYLPTSDRSEILSNLVPIMAKDKRVVFHGGVSKVELADAMLSAAVLAYPCDPVSPTEGFSMTILDGWSAGCKVVTTDADALPELWGGFPNVVVTPLPVDDGVFVDAMCEGLDNIRPSGPRSVPKEFWWSSIAEKWVSLLL